MVMKTTHITSWEDLQSRGHYITKPKEFSFLAEKSNHRFADEPFDPPAFFLEKTFEQVGKTE